MWNKRAVILCAFLGLVLSICKIQAQQETDTTLVYVRAETLTKKGEFLEGKMSLTSDYLLQFNIMFVDTIKWQTYYFSPKDIEYITYSVDSNDYTLVSLVNPRNDGGMLMLREIYKGRYSLYQLVDQDHSQTVLTYTAFYYMYSDKWHLPGLTHLNFIYDGILLFADCPELSRKIKNGVYDYSDLYQVIVEFNQCGIPDNFDYLMDPEY